MHWCLVVDGLVAAGFGVRAWVWDQGYPLILDMSSSFNEGGVGVELCAQGIALYDL